MTLKMLKWLKYLFIGKTEAETEQNYWNEKRKKHLANEHTAGVISGLDVTEDSPPSLFVKVAIGRAVDSEGNDPEIESIQTVDCTSLVPGASSQTVYITLEYGSVETDPYYVEELAAYQNKYIQDSYTLQATLTPPVAPTLELARIELATGATEIADPVDPANPTDNEIDSRYRAVGCPGFTHLQYTFILAGEIEVMDDSTPWLVVGQDCKVESAYAIAKTGPTGAAMTLEVERSGNDGVDWATVVAAADFEISAGDVVGEKIGLVFALSKNDVLRLNIDATGSVIPGSDLSVFLRVKL